MRDHEGREWRMVPLEPIPEMSAKGFVVSEPEHDPAGVYRAMIAAAPAYVPSEADVERVAKALDAESCGPFLEVFSWDTATEDYKRQQRRYARAAIAALIGKDG